jgi:hypothetical protein
MVGQATTLLPSVHDCARKIKAGFAAIKIAQSFPKHKKTKNTKQKPRQIAPSRGFGKVLLVLLVPTARLELAQLSPLPPQDSVSTNSTTSAIS